MELDIDWKLIHRLDDAMVTQFLASSAAALTETQAISQKDSDELRLSLQGIAEGKRDHQTSLLMEIDAQKGKFLRILIHRYGEVGLALNLARMGLRPLLDELRQTLAKHGQDLVNKCRLHLNRGVYVGIGGRFSRQVLFSSMIVDLSVALNHAIERLQTIDASLKNMLPSDIAPYHAEDLAIDEAMAAHLGFASLQREAVPFLAERMVHRELACLVLAMTDAVDEFMHQCQLNALMPALERASSLCAWLKAEAQRIQTLTFPQSIAVSSWELRRYNFFSSVIILTHTLDRMWQVVQANLGPILTGQAIEVSMAASSQRFVISSLVQGGCDISLAEQAAAALVAYCDTKKVAPRDILPEEFPHIHANLAPTLLQKMQEAALDTVKKNKASEEKHQITHKITFLQSEFSRVLTQALMLITLALFFVPGCGVKLAPKSQRETLRPEIPFKPSRIQAPVSPPLQSEPKKSNDLGEKPAP